jgi:hypothetical protein
VQTAVPPAGTRFGEKGGSESGRNSAYQLLSHSRSRSQTARSGVFLEKFIVPRVVKEFAEFN